MADTNIEEREKRFRPPDSRKKKRNGGVREKGLTRNKREGDHVWVGKKQKRHVHSVNSGGKGETNLRKVGIFRSITKKKKREKNGKASRQREKDGT